MIKAFLVRNSLFINYLIGCLTSAFPMILQEYFPDSPSIRLTITIILVGIGCIFSFLFSSSSKNSKILWTVAIFFFFGCLFYLLPSNFAQIKITNPKDYQKVIPDPETGLITIQGKVSKELYSRFEEKLLYIYVVKFDDKDRAYFESYEPAYYDRGTWTKTLPFYNNQEFKIIAIAAPSVDIAKSYELLSKAYKSDPITFTTER